MPTNDERITKADRCRMKDGTIVHVAKIEGGIVTGIYSTIDGDRIAYWRAIDGAPCTDSGIVTDGSAEPLRLESIGRPEEFVIDGADGYQLTLRLCDDEGGIYVTVCGFKRLEVIDIGFRVRWSRTVKLGNWLRDVHAYLGA